MAMTESKLRRIIREEAHRVMEQQTLGAAAAKLGSAAQAYAPQAARFAQGAAAKGAQAARALAPQAAKYTAFAAAKGAQFAALDAGAAAAAAPAAATAAVLSAALLGIGIGTVINKGLNKFGINDAVVDWALAQRVSKEGIDFEARLDPAVLAGNLDKATGKLTAAGTAGSLRPMSFALTGVNGILINPDTNAVDKNNVFHGFGNASTQLPVNGVAKLRMPKKPEGVFVPAQLIGQVVYEGGVVVNLVSKEGTLVTQPGTSIVKGTLISSKKLGT